MKKITLIAVLIALVFTANAFCAPISHSDSEIERLAAGIVDKVVDSFNNNNYAKMASHFDERMLREFPQRKFEKARNSVFPISGKINSTEYLGFRTQSAATLIFYKAVSETGIIIIKLVLSEKANDTKIAGLWFE